MMMTSALPSVVAFFLFSITPLIFLDLEVESVFCLFIIVVFYPQFIYLLTALLRAFEAYYYLPLLVVIYDCSFPLYFNDFCTWFAVFYLPLLLSSLNINIQGWSSYSWPLSSLKSSPWLLLSSTPSQPLLSLSFSLQHPTLTSLPFFPTYSIGDPSNNFTTQNIWQLTLLLFKSLSTPSKGLAFLVFCLDSTLYYYYHSFESVLNFLESFFTFASFHPNT